MLNADVDFMSLYTFWLWNKL